MVELAMVNEPSVFESLKFYCNTNIRDAIGTRVNYQYTYAWEIRRHFSCLYWQSNQFC